MLYHIVRKAIGEDFAWQRRNRHSSGFALEHVAEMLKVAVASTDGGLLEFEGGYVGYHVDFVVGVHVTPGAVGARIANLLGCVVSRGKKSCEWELGAYWNDVLLSRECSLAGHRVLRRFVDEALPWTGSW
jgi:hypothetical protein